MTGPTHNRARPGLNHHLKSKHFQGHCDWFLCFGLAHTTKVLTEHDISEQNRKLFTQRFSLPGISVNELVESLNSKVRHVVYAVAPAEEKPASGKRWSFWRKATKMSKSWGQAVEKQIPQVHCGICKERLRNYNVEPRNARQSFVSDITTKNRNNTQIIHIRFTLAQTWKSGRHHTTSEALLLLLRCDAWPLIFCTHIPSLGCLPTSSQTSSFNWPFGENRFSTAKKTLDVNRTWRSEYTLCLLHLPCWHEAVPITYWDLKCAMQVRD